MLRRDRVHLHGRSNKDILDKPQTADPNVNRIDSLSIPKKKKDFIAVLEERMKRVATAENPLKQTMDFYKSTQKPKKTHVQIPHPRFANLEEKELRKRVFVGDSNTIYDEHLHIQEGIQSPKLQHSKTHLIKQKHDQHANAIQETQLVGLNEYNKNTLEGRVDLEKVREIRRAIRRRYANRKNFQKIFNLWDEDSQGAISVKNLYNMLKRLQINVNFDEARVLLASSDKDGSNDLALNEFLDLIFNEKDALNVNLKALPVLSEDEQNSMLSGQTLQFLRDDAKQSEARRRENQVNLILKNRLSQLNTWLAQADLLQKGYLNYGRFEGVIKKLEIDPKIISDDDIKGIYNRFSKREDAFDIKDFVSHLKEFQMNPEDIYRDPYAKQPQNKKQEMIMEMKAREDERVAIFDCTRVNAWHLEQMRKKAQQVITSLQRYVPTKEEFKKLLTQRYNQGERITAREVESILNAYLTSVNEKPNKTQMESLLSVVQFGQYEIVPLDDVAKILYEETDEQFYERAQQRKLGPVPPPDKAFNKLKANTSAPQIEMQQDSDREHYYSTGLVGRAIKGPLSKILTKIDETVFRQSERAFKLYKDFDVDKDGYVSHQDLTSKIKQFNILDDNEIGLLLKYVDPDQKGFTNFQEFHSKLRAGMTMNDQRGQQLVLSSAEPSRVRVDQQIAYLPELKATTEEFKKPFKPETFVLRPPTRFGLTPPSGNLFSVLQPSPGSAMYQSSAERFSKDPLSRQQYQVDEKMKKQATEKARLLKISAHQQEREEKIKQQYQNEDIKDANKIKTKYLAQWTYDHKAHLKNDYL